MDLGPDRSLMILDDDEPFLRRLTRAMEKRGFEVAAVDSVAAARRVAEERPPAYAVVDLRLEDGNGLEVVGALRSHRPDARIVVLTGYGAIASAVAAVKIGATDYLAKPADANDITRALLVRDAGKPAPPEHPMTADRMRWEHIQRIYELSTATSRRRRGGSTCTGAPCSASCRSAALDKASILSRRLKDREALLARFRQRFRNVCQPTINGGRQMSGYSPNSTYDRINRP